MANIIIMIIAASTILGIQLGTRYWRNRRTKVSFNKGMEAYTAKEYDAAVRAFRKCVRLAPQWLYARTLMAISLAHRGQVSEALKEIEMVEAFQPREGDTWALIVTFFVLSMPENEERVFDALERLAALDAQTAKTLIEQPCFLRYNGSPKFIALKKTTDTSLPPTPADGNANF